MSPASAVVAPRAFEPALLAAVRARFPALATDWALFDNAGGSVATDGVIARVRDHMERLGVQLGASHALSVEAAARVAAGHRAAELLLGADPGEVVLGPSTTANLRTFAHAFGATLSPGDSLVVSDLDHESNIGAWRMLESRGITVRTWALRPATQMLHVEDLEPLLVPRTRLVAFTHCANVVGSIHDARAAIDRIHAAGALAAVDGVAYAPHRSVDVKALGADLYVVSLYKLFGPHLGMLYGRRELLERVQGQNHFFKAETELPDKLEPGGVPHELASALPGIVEHLLALEAMLPGGGVGDDRARMARAFDAIAAHEAALVAPLLADLAARPGVRVLGESTADPARRVATVAFTVEGRHASSVPTALDRARLATRWGHFYAHRAMTALGLHERGGVVRVSLAHYNTPAEVQRLLEALDDALAH
ncbi:MAG: cysteine desulfurase-like protein [bacterium]